MMLPEIDGIRGAIVRGKWAEWKDTNNWGWGCGYIGVSQGHPWYDCDYSELCDILTDIEPTYSSYKLPWEVNMYGIKWIGFDTAHVGMNIHNWSEDAVREQTKKWQLLAAAEILKRTKG